MEDWNIPMSIQKKTASLTRSIENRYIAKGIETISNPRVDTPVILSAAKNLNLNQCSREILRCAQDDRKGISGWLPFILLAALLLVLLAACGDSNSDEENGDMDSSENEDSPYPAYYILEDGTMDLPEDEIYYTMTIHEPVAGCTCEKTDAACCGSSRDVLRNCEKPSISISIPNLAHDHPWLEDHFLLGYHEIDHKNNYAFLTLETNDQDSEDNNIFAATMGEIFIWRTKEDGQLHSCQQALFANGQSHSSCWDWTRCGREIPEDIMGENSSEFWNDPPTSAVSAQIH